VFERILIANRGEIACRVIRTCRRLGVGTVAVYSSADANARHVRLADTAVAIGGPRPADSYLRGDAIIAAARATGAQAIHPGYGFLSENADFAEAVEAAGLVFIGPRAESMRRMGSKAGAKQLMAGHGVPVVPGYTGEDQDPERLAAEAGRIGYPLMIKAAHGGGGKGMRVVREPGAFLDALASCQREAAGAFGRDRVLLERYIERPRHIEFQIFGDHAGRVVHLGERECSAQRRYQKVIEESPSPFVDETLRAHMGEAAVAAGRALAYVNAGTVEFIVGQDRQFYFMEINTRLQVEHPVTELVLGMDLVELQLRVASGEALPVELPPARGHAIEVRLYAEDPQRGFLPGSGRIERLVLPGEGPHVRIDGGVVEGDTVTIHYDPMVAKLIAWDADRPRALARLAGALAGTAMLGPKSNIDFLERLIRHPRVVDAEIDTGYLDAHLAEVLPADAADDVPAAMRYAAAAWLLLREEAATAERARASGDPYSPFAIADGFRLGHRGTRVIRIGHGGHDWTLRAHGDAGAYRFDEAGGVVEVSLHRETDGALVVGIDGELRRLGLHDLGSVVELHDGTRRWRFEALRAYAHEGASTGSGDRVQAPMPGRIVAVRTSAGASVAAGAELVVMEAMKMEITLRAPRDGAIEAVSAVAGEFVEADAVLVRMVPA
jgi:3-methylcrotonyl-CoA carboxylase alpha subunit